MRTNKQILQACAKPYLQYEHTYKQMQRACKVHGTTITRARIMAGVAGQQSALYPLLVTLGIDADLLYKYVDAERRALADKSPTEKEEEELLF